MDNYLFMLLAVEIPHLHLVKKVKICFLNPGKIVQRKRLLCKTIFHQLPALLHKHLEADFQALEQFVVRLNSSTINTCKVNVARRMLFAKGGRTVENISLMFDALKQHIKRSVFRAIKWSQCLI